jgi:hypothetical protein
MVGLEGFGKTEKSIDLKLESIHSLSLSMTNCCSAADSAMCEAPNCRGDVATQASKDAIDGQVLVTSLSENVGARCNGSEHIGGN